MDGIEGLADEEIIERIRTGEPQLFDCLVRKYETKLTNLATYFVKEPHEAKDICQETFLKAFLGLAHFRAESSFYTWIYRIGVNTAKNHIKSQGYRLLRSHCLPEEMHDLIDVPAQACSPEENLVRDEVSEDFEKILKSLPRDLQLCLIFREIHGMSYEQIAEIMHCPVGTVRSRIHRARCYFEGLSRAH